MQVNHKKLIVNIPEDNLREIEEASKLTYRNRNNFIIFSALKEARILLNKMEAIQ